MKLTHHPLYHKQSNSYTSPTRPHPTDSIANMKLLTIVFAALLSGAVAAPMAQGTDASAKPCGQAGEPACTPPTCTRRDPKTRRCCQPARYRDLCVD